MDFKKLRKMAGDPKFISGIYNYCDRWCERCEFTSRCLNYSMTSEDDARDPASRDIQNQAFWDRLHNVFRETIQMIREDAKERGIDLEMSPEEVKAFEKEESRKRREAKNHPASKAAWKYVKMVDKWFDDNKPLFEEEERKLNSAFLMELPGQDHEEEAALLQDALEVIGWYQHQIWVKLQRALHQDDDDDLLDDEGKPYPRDSDGSAKVALLGIDRSIEAWGVLRRYLPTGGDSILGTMVHLDRLRKRVERAFPAARAFVRPGFDGPIPGPAEA
ncbi:MAG: hypothetical protein FJ291_13165 [Planctomycetes bacterium]|nr:hypothetical protein [Planctomycetota bacterium]